MVQGGLLGQGGGQGEKGGVEGEGESGGEKDGKGRKGLVGVESSSEGSGEDILTNYGSLGNAGKNNGSHKIF